MPSEPRRVYWDSCVYIDCIQRHPERHAVLDLIIEQAKGGEIVLVASALVLAEVSKLNDPNATILLTSNIVKFFTKLSGPIAASV